MEARALAWLSAPPRSPFPANDVTHLIPRPRDKPIQLRGLLSARHSAIERPLREHDSDQVSLADSDKYDRAQRLADAEHMRKRIDEESRSEPEQIETLYQVALQQLTPVGLVVLWPSTRS